MKRSVTNTNGALADSKKRKRQPSQTIEEAILEAAEAAIGVNGESDFTLVRIAKMLEISPSTIYEHFRSKAALMEVVHQRLENKEASR